jgi:hypothetical protein
VALFVIADDVSLSLTPRIQYMGEKSTLNSLKKYFLKKYFLKKYFLKKYFLDLKKTLRQNCSTLIVPE